MWNGKSMFKMCYSICKWEMLDVSCAMLDVNCAMLDVNCAMLDVKC
jgi:hypothetical protein